jgi:hypothetical protein
MGSATSTTQISVEFTALTTATQYGGASVDSYHLQWDSGTSGGTWTDLIGQDGSYQLLTTHTVTGVAGGGAYRFKVRAHNLHDWGAFSDEAVIYATSVPGQPDPVVTV